MVKGLKIFVVFHYELNTSYYDDSLIENFIFVNVKPENLNLVKYPKYKIINLHEFENLTPLGKYYTESEVIYNIYRNKYLYEGSDFIGFLQYDIDSSPLNKESLTELLRNFNHINFEPHSFQSDFNQKILMDISKPNIPRGKGKNCYEAILEDYNNFYGTEIKISEILKEDINLCSSFILEVNIFEDMMAFISEIIESEKLNLFDTNHKNRIQGGLLERYYGLWLILKKTNVVKFPLIHEYLETQNQNKRNLITKLLRKIFKK